MKKSLLALLALIALSVSLTRAEAAITFNVNTSAHEVMWFAGSSTGLGGSASGLTEDIIRWTEGSIHTPETLILPNNLFTSNHEILETKLIFSFVANLRLEIRVAQTEDKTPITITGSGVTYSYAGLAIAAKNVIQLLADRQYTMLLTSGSGFEPIQMEAVTSAVPEPSSLALLGLAALGGYLIRRKKA